MKTQLLSALFFLLSVTCFSQWTPVNINSGYSLKKVIFTDSTTGYLIGDTIIGLNLAGKIYKTSDAGITWDQKDFILLANSDIDFIHSDTVFVSSNDGQYTYTRLTTNGGTTWLTVNPDAPNGPQHFISATKGFATKNISGNIEIYKTTDGGAFWKPTTITSGPSAVQDIQYINATEGFVGGLYGPLMANINMSMLQVNYMGAQTFATHELQFFNSDTGYFAALETVNNISSLYFTPDKGITIQPTIDFTLFGLAASEEIISFDCYDLMHCLCLTISGIMFYTDDGGVSWWNENSGYQNLYSVDYQPGFAIAVGENGLVLRRDFSTAVNEVSIKNQFRCFPNPAQQSITVSGSGIIYPITIIDLAGKTVSVSQDATIETKALTPGIYFARIETSRGVYHTKFVRL